MDLISVAECCVSVRSLGHWGLLWGAGSKQRAGYICLGPLSASLLTYDFSSAPAAVGTSLMGPPAGPKETFPFPSISSWARSSDEKQTNSQPL